MGMSANLHCLRSNTCPLATQALVLFSGQKIINATESSTGSRSHSHLLISWEPDPSADDFRVITRGKQRNVDLPSQPYQQRNRESVCEVRVFFILKTKPTSPWALPLHDRRWLRQWQRSLPGSSSAHHRSHRRPRTGVHWWGLWILRNLLGRSPHCPGVSTHPHQPSHSHGFQNLGGPLALCCRAGRPLEVDHVSKLPLELHRLPLRPEVSGSMKWPAKRCYARIQLNNMWEAMPSPHMKSVLSNYGWIDFSNMPRIAISNVTCKYDFTWHEIHWEQLEHVLVWNWHDLKYSASC